MSTSYETVIGTADLGRHLDDPDWAIVDCRFDLGDTGAGEGAYRESHIPGAVYAHLDRDLSGPVEAGKTSRHPLPTVDKFARTLGSWGIDARVQVVVYDDRGGAIAARLWWMLRWLGHRGVAVLDGGWPAWMTEERPTRGGVEGRLPRAFTPSPRPELVVEAAELVHHLDDPGLILVDARAPERYRGEIEPNDPVAGHIPGAVNHFFGQNLAEERFLPREELRAHYEHLLGERKPEDVVFYCGSGVTAAHNALAMLHAGLGEARLYPGSWSEWITDATRPVQRGE